MSTGDTNELGKYLTSKNIASNDNPVVLFNFTILKI